ncbi:MAG: tRNA (adenosine(37)-N6)-dimethylallyltransferase MiaA [Flavobacteriales bacterium]
MPKLIVIGGPTASGKTKLAIELAQQLDGEIINGDSRQFYRGLNIGTAKPNAEEQRSIPHHFIDIKDPEEDYNAGEFELDVVEFLSSYFKRKEFAILVGGSGLYINAVVNGFDKLPSQDQTLRQKWSESLEGKGIESLQIALRKLDPEYYNIVDLNNPQRLIRALEVCESTGRPYSSFRSSSIQERSFKIKGFWLNPPRDKLYTRINKRVEQMMFDGLLDEVQSNLPYRHCNALQTVGYAELFDFLDGKTDLSYAVDKIMQHTRNYAKRQVTWFKKQSYMIELNDNNLEAILRHLNIE